MLLWVGMVFVLMAAIYTASYGWWAWQKKLYLGAIGTWMVALTSVGLPILLVMLGIIHF